jgi:hypothetical protein
MRVRGRRQQVGACAMQILERNFLRSTHRGPYNGFRFEFSRRSVSAPEGLLKTQYIAVAQSYQGALAAVCELVENSPDLRLTDTAGSFERS